MVLSVQNVSYTYHTKYQTVQAVHDATCQMEAGRLYAVVGKSGSGKTTLLSLLAGLEKPQTGNILLDGENLRNMDIDQYRRSRAAVIYQSYNLFPLLSVQENVVYPLLLNGLPRVRAVERAQRTLARFGLDELYWKRLPAMLSGGEQQRVAVARALAVEAKLILADEPTGNLDAENTKQIVELLLTLAHEQNCCVVVVTHDMEIANMADRVFSMDNGRIAEVRYEHS